MADYTITCIRKPNRFMFQDRILAVGGGGLLSWEYSVDEVIQMLRSGDRFWVSVGGQTVEVREHIRNGIPYIRTDADTTLSDNLLSLPECR